MAGNIYCSRHGSNLINRGSCHSSMTAVNIYGTDSKPGEIQKVKTFLSSEAHKRHNIFQSHEGKYVRFKELAATQDIRFVAARQATVRLLEMYRPVMIALDEISHNTKDFFAILNPLNVKLQGRATDLSLIIRGRYSCRKIESYS